MSTQQCILLLGSNLGNTKKNILSAIDLIGDRAGTILTKSEFLYSDPEEFASSHKFCNIALILNTQLSPARLLMALKDIERQMGRTEDSGITGEYQDRVIDIDIVSYGNVCFQSKRLTLPHLKHCFEREFSRVLLEDLNQKSNDLTELYFR